MLHILWYIFLHMTGIDTQQSRFYDYWSGIATQATVFGGIFVFLKHKNCHVKGCWRIVTATDPVHGWPACRKHHSMSEAL